MTVSRSTSELFRIPKMKPTGTVVHCIATLEGGGAERQLCYLVRALVEKGWCVHVAILRRGVNFKRLQESGAEIHEIAAKSNYDLLIIARLIRLLKRVGPCAVQCWQRPMDIYASIAAFLVGQPFITMERTSPKHIGLSPKTLFRLFMAQFSRAVVSNSSEGRDYWHRRLIGRMPNIVIGNIVPFEEMPVPSESLQRGEYIIAVGRLSIEKNCRALVDAMETIALRDSNIKLHIFGTGSEYDSMLLAIRDKKLDNNIALHGYQSDVWEWVRHAKVYVSLSLFEGSPNAVLEAAALGTPMLLSDIPAHRMYFDETSATFVNATCAEEISRQLLNMLDHYELSIQKASIARNTVQENTSDAISNHYIDLYHQFLG